MRLRMLQLACYRQIKKLQLVIVDTTSAPALYIVGLYYSSSLRSPLKYTDS